MQLYDVTMQNAGVKAEKIEERLAAARAQVNLRVSRKGK